MGSRKVPSIRRSTLDSALQAAVESAGRRRVAEMLRQIAAAGSDRDVLTIVVNEGIHVLSAEYRRGEVFSASKGALDFSSARSVKAEYRKILGRTALKLKERAWRRIYIVPFGPTTLAMQIKLLVYRVVGVESIDVAHLGSNTRADIEINLRRIAERNA